MYHFDLYFLMQIVNQREAASSNIFKHKEFNLESLGIGGLGAEFADIFRRAFASRVFPPHVTSRFCALFFKQMVDFCCGFSFDVSFS